MAASASRSDAHCRHSPASAATRSASFASTPFTIGDRALRLAGDERLEFLLAVDIDEELAECPHALRGLGLPVHVLARAAVAPDDATQDDFAVLRLDGLLFEPAPRPPDWRRSRKSP
jgi:hypothetical protein